MRRKTGFPHCCDDLLGRYGGYKRPKDQQAVCQISGRYGLYSFLWSGKTTNPCPDVQVVMTCHDINVTPIHYPPRWCRCSFKRPRTCPRFPWSSLRSRSQRTTPTRIGSPSQPCPPKCPPLHHWHRRRRRPMGRRRRLRWSRPSKASPELRPWRCRQRRHLRRSFQLFQQQLRRRCGPTVRTEQAQLCSLGGGTILGMVKTRGTFHESNIAMENGWTWPIYRWFTLIHLLKIVIFYSYVRLPEGIQMELYSAGR